MKRFLIIILGLLLIAACAKEAPVNSQMPVLENGENVEETAVNSQGETTVVEEAKEEAKNAPVVKYEIEASQWSFRPNTITVKKGSHVVLTVTSKDVDHGFGIAAYGINQKVPAGRAADVEFDADKVGEFPFYCTTYCGSGHSGMKGKLVVTE